MKNLFRESTNKVVEAAGPSFIARNLILARVANVLSFAAGKATEKVSFVNFVINSWTDAAFLLFRAPFF